MLHVLQPRALRSITGKHRQLCLLASQGVVRPESHNNFPIGWQLIPYFEEELDIDIFLTDLVVEWDGPGFDQ